MITVCESYCTLCYCSISNVSRQCKMNQVLLLKIHQHCGLLG